MKILSRIDGSVCGVLLSTRPSTTRAAVSSRSKLQDGRPPRAPASRHRRGHTTDSPSQVLHCPQTASWLLSTFLLSAPSRRPRPINQDMPYRQPSKRYGHTSAAAAVKPRDHEVSGSDKEVLLGFVDNTDSGTVAEHLNYIQDPYRSGYAQPEPPRLTISEREQDTEYPSLEEVRSRDGEHIVELVTKLGKAVSTKLRYPRSIGLDTIYARYMDVPEPRMLHIQSKLRHDLLSVFGVPKKRDSKTMLQYFSLIGDVKDAGIFLRRNEWNHAMAFASRYVGRTSETEAEAALQLWKEMEKLTRTRANEVTFNILFDAASKSGNFALAELIYKEMENRKIRFNRFHHVSLIHFFGLKHDPDGVRAAYKELVEAGELVDTVVLNCVISSFLRCHEETAAVRVYDHMRTVEGKLPQIGEKMEVTDRMVKHIFAMLTKVGKHHPDLRPRFQAISHRNPDIRTYRALIGHFSAIKGNLFKVVEYLDDMASFGIVTDGGIFLQLFKGFAVHGGYRGSDWDAARLESVLTALLEGVDAPSSTLYLDTWLMMSALRAFMRCTNKETTLDVYDQFKLRWQLKPDRAQFMDAYVNRLLSNQRESEGRSFFSRSRFQTGKKRVGKFKNDPV